MRGKEGKGIFLSQACTLLTLQVPFTIIGDMVTKYAICHLYHITGMPVIFHFRRQPATMR